MKKLSAIITALLCTSGSYAQYFPVDTAVLNTAYRNLTIDGSAENQRIFFLAFPSTWQEFSMTYQFVPDDKYDKTMYRLAEKHIADGLGTRMTAIPDSLYCRKLIGLAAGGSWEPDAASYLNGVIRKAVAEKPGPMMKQLSETREGERFRFWYFYWSSPVEAPESRKEMENLIRELPPEYAVLGATVRTAYETACGKIDPLPFNYPHLRDPYRHYPTRTPEGIKPHKGF